MLYYWSEIAHKTQNIHTFSQGKEDKNQTNKQKNKKTETNKQRKNKRSSAYENKEYFCGMNVTFRSKESQLECLKKWQNYFNIVGRMHPALLVLSHRAKFVRGKRGSKHHWHVATDKAALWEKSFKQIIFFLCYNNSMVDSHGQKQKQNSFFSHDLFPSRAGYGAAVEASNFDTAMISLCRIWSLIQISLGNSKLEPKNWVLSSLKTNRYRKHFLLTTALSILSCAVNQRQVFAWRLENLIFFLSKLSLLPMQATSHPHKFMSFLLNSLPQPQPDPPLKLTHLFQPSKLQPLTMCAHSLSTWIPQKVSENLPSLQPFPEALGIQKHQQLICLCSAKKLWTNWVTVLITLRW